MKLLHLFKGMLVSHQRGFPTSQVQLLIVVAVSRTATGMEALVADMMMIVTKPRTKIILVKTNLINMFLSLIKELLQKEKHLIIAGKLIKGYHTLMLLLVSLSVIFTLYSVGKFSFTCN